MSCRSWWPSAAGTGMVLAPSTAPLTARCGHPYRVHSNRGVRRYQGAGPKHPWIARLGDLAIEHLSNGFQPAASRRRRTVRPPAAEHRSDRRELPDRAGWGERKEHDVPDHVGDEGVAKCQIHGIDETRHHGQGEKRSVRSGRLSGSGTPVPASRLKELDRVTRGIVDQDL